MLPDRINSIDGFLISEAKYFRHDKVQSALCKIFDWRKDCIADSNLKRCDTSLLEASQVRDWLRSLPIRGEVTAIWVPDREAMQISYSSFVKHYNKLWFPSADDVWITGECFSFLLELSHEEVFTFLERPGDKRGHSTY